MQNIIEIGTKLTHTIVSGDFVHFLRNSDKRRYNCMAFCVRYRPEKISAPHRTDTRARTYGAAQGLSWRAVWLVWA